MRVEPAPRSSRPSPSRRWRRWSTSRTTRGCSTRASTSASPGALGFTSRTVADVLLPLDQLETVDRRSRASPTSRSSAPDRLLAVPGRRRRRRAGRLPAHQGRAPVRPARAGAQVVDEMDPAVRRRCGSTDTLVTRTADAPGQGRAHGARWSTTTGTVAGRGHARGRHRGARRRDPRRGARRRALSARCDWCGDPAGRPAPW